MDDAMEIIGLTGGTGSGKSSVAKIFGDNGIHIIDADQVSRTVCSKGSPCLQELTHTFGVEILLANGELNRKLLGDLAFADKAKLAKLNSITHKYIHDEIDNLIHHLDGAGVILDAALLFESGENKRCNAVIAVIAEKDIRAARIASRDDLTPEQALARIKAQHDEGFYTEKADFVIYNNGDFDELKLQTDLIVDVIFGN